MKRPNVRSWCNIHSILRNRTLDKFDISSIRQFFKSMQATRKNAFRTDSRAMWRILTLISCICRGILSWFSGEKIDGRLFSSKSWSKRRKRKRKGESKNYLQLIVLKVTFKEKIPDFSYVFRHENGITNCMHGFYV